MRRGGSFFLLGEDGCPPGLLWRGSAAVCGVRFVPSASDPRLPRSIGWYARRV